MKTETSESKLRVSEIVSSTKVSVVIITCAADAEELKESLSVVQDSYSILIADDNQLAKCKTLDSGAKLIQDSDVVIISLSPQFVINPIAFRMMIFVTRTLNKPFRYFNLMSIAEGKNGFKALTENDDYKSSSASMLVAKSLLYDNWIDLFDNWIRNFKTNVMSDTFNQITLAPMEGQYMCCYTDEDKEEAEMILNSIPEYKCSVLSEIPDGGIDEGTINCFLIFVTHSTTVDRRVLRVIEEMMDSQVPIVVVVLTEKTTYPWVNSGLGILLANELWIDFTLRPFYLPGEVVPCHQKRVADLTYRMKDACKSRVVKSKDGISAKDASLLEGKLSKNTEPRSCPLKVFISHCNSDDPDMNIYRTWPPLEIKSTPENEMNHVPVRYAAAVHAMEEIDLFMDFRIKEVPRDFFDEIQKSLLDAKIVLEFWSAAYISSFACYNEVHFRSYHNKKAIIVFLEPFDVIAKEFSKKQQSEATRIFEEIFPLRRCYHTTGYVRHRNTFGISAVGRPYEEVKTVLVNLLQSAASMSNHGEDRRDKVLLFGMPRVINSDGGDYDFDVLISYNWLNSAIANSVGDVSTVEGRTDPRFLKQEIERETGLRVWLDVEQLGADGLFQGLHKALSSKSLSCVLLCISDEYAHSLNCNMELQYAINRVPCLVAGVGNGYGWKSKTAGYFAASQETFDFTRHPFPGSEEGTQNFNSLLIRLWHLCMVKNCDNGTYC